MPLQTHGRDIAESGSEDDKANYQRFEHDPIDVLQFTLDSENGTPIAANTRYPASVRIYCPEIRVVSRIGVIFQPQDPNEVSSYDLSTLNNTIVAYRCMNARSRIARVGEIIGKNGVPLAFPKSDIDGIAFQSDDDMPWIDIDLELGFPGVAGSWTVFYHATADNKLKTREWQGYISRVTMTVQSSPGLIRYSIGGRGVE
jgi:hypothetical protein